MRRWHETASRLRSFDAAPARKLVVYEVRARVQCPTALTLDKCRPFVGLTGVYMYTCHCTVMHFCTRGKTSVHIHCRTCCVRARTLARSLARTHPHTHTHAHTRTHTHTRTRTNEHVRRGEDTHTRAPESTVAMSWEIQWLSSSSAFCASAPRASLRHLGRDRISSGPNIPVFGMGIEESSCEIGCLESQ